MSNKCSNPECEFGWIYGKYSVVDSVKLRTGEIVEKVTEYEGVTPCPTCDPKRAKIFAESNSKQELEEKLQNQSPHKRLIAYEKAEDSKTRVL